MDFIGRILLSALVPITIGGILYGLASLEGKASDNTVRLPKYYSWVGIICTLVSASGLFWMNLFPNGSESLFATIVFILFIVLGIGVASEGKNWKIVYSESGFVYTTFLGRSYAYKYSDVKKIKRTTNTIHLFTSDRHLYIDVHADGIEGFFEAKNHYRGNRRS